MGVGRCPEGGEGSPVREQDEQDEGHDSLSHFKGTQVPALRQSPRPRAPPRRGNAGGACLSQEDPQLHLVLMSSVYKRAMSSSPPRPGSSREAGVRSSRRWTERLACSRHRLQCLSGHLSLPLAAAPGRAAGSSRGLEPGRLTAGPGEANMPVSPRPGSVSPTRPSGPPEWSPAAASCVSSGTRVRNWNLRAR